MFSRREDENRRLLRARDAVDRSFAQPLDVPAPARIALISPAHFTRRFRAVFGETPHRRRIERACALLRDTELTPSTPSTCSDQDAARDCYVDTLGGLGTTILTTDDCRATDAELAAKGVEFTQEPVVQSYGIDCALRDPLANHLRITQPTRS